MINSFDLDIETMSKEQINRLAVFERNKLNAELRGDHFLSSQYEIKIQQQLVAKEGKVIDIY